MAGLAGNKVADDVMIEILSRTPPKSLVRFECISKSWSEITGDRYLMAFHHQKLRPPAPKSCIFTTKSDPEFRRSGFSLLGADHSFADLRLPKPNKRGTRIEAIGDGILYVSRYFNSEDDYLWNPCIRQVKIVPSFHPKPPADTSRFGIRTGSCYGVGLDPKSNRVKVVRIRTYPFDQTLADVWTVGDRHGREINSVPIFPPRNFGNLYINGKCYWTGWGPGYRNRLSFVSFDMATEKFECLPLPAELTDLRPVMGQLKESVAFFAFRHREGSCEVDIWLMNKHTCLSKYKSIVIELMGPPSGPINSLFPLGFCNETEMVFRCKNNNFLFFRNVETGETTFVKNRVYFTSVRFYTESILSIQGRKYERAVMNHEISSPLV